MPKKGDLIVVVNPSLHDYGKRYTFSHKDEVFYFVVNGSYPSGNSNRLFYPREIRLVKSKPKFKIGEIVEIKDTPCGFGGLSNCGIVLGSNKVGSIVRTNSSFGSVSIHHEWYYNNRRLRRV